MNICFIFPFRVLLVLVVAYFSIKFLGFFPPWVLGKIRKLTILYVLQIFLLRLCFYFSIYLATQKVYILMKSHVWTFFFFMLPICLVIFSHCKIKTRFHRFSSCPFNVAVRVLFYFVFTWCFYLVSTDWGKMYCIEYRVYTGRESPK